MNKQVTDIEKAIFTINDASFEALAIEVFLFQYEQNKIYRQFCEALKIIPSAVTDIAQIPFLPIQFFKSKEVCSTSFEPAVIFESSGTSGSVNSRHLVKKVQLYEESFFTTFQQFYGDVTKLCILGLLPSYLEKGSSSLVYMVNELVKKSAIANSGFYLYDLEKLSQTLQENERANTKTLLIGVTYALLDFADTYPMQLKNTVVMETGGMKGRREEITREEVHAQLTARLGLTDIHSEYGMTELLSQAYSKGNGVFACPPWMKILLRSEDDPFNIVGKGHIQKAYTTGVINVIDLANLYSCSFIATDDVGKLYPDDSFEVLGRLDNSDIRGCGLMIL